DPDGERCSLDLYAAPRGDCHVFRDDPSIQPGPAHGGAAPPDRIRGGAGAVPGPPAAAEQPATGQRATAVHRRAAAVPRLVAAKHGIRPFAAATEFRADRLSTNRRLADHDTTDQRFVQRHNELQHGTGFFAAVTDRSAELPATNECPADRVAAERFV